MGNKDTPLLGMILTTTANGVAKGPGANDLPWMTSYPQHQRRIRELVAHSAIIMGRETWEIDNQFRARKGPSLFFSPGKNIVLSRQKQFRDRVPDLASAVEEASYWASLGHDVWVVGGLSVFEKFFPLVDRVDHSLLVHEPQPQLKNPGVFRVPPIHQHNFELEWEGPHPQDERIEIKQWRRTRGRQPKSIPWCSALQKMASRL